MGLSVTVKLQGQNCKRLDSKVFFKSIKLGEQIPVDLTACSKKTKLEYSYYTDYRLEHSSFNQGCRKKYSDLFNFLSMPFDFSIISTTQKGKIFYVELYSFFDDNRHGDSINYMPPPNFIGIYNKLVLLYGKPTRIQEAKNQDSLFIKELGIPRQIEWECNTINLRLRVNYGSLNKDLNVIDIQVRNTRLEFEQANQQ